MYIVRFFVITVINCKEIIDESHLLPHSRGRLFLQINSPCFCSRDERSIFKVINKYKHIFSIFRILVTSDQRSQWKIYLFASRLALSCACLARIARAPYPFAASLIIIPWYLLPDVSFISVDDRRRTGWTWWSRESDGTSFVDRPTSLLSFAIARVTISKRSSIFVPMHTGRDLINFWNSQKFPISSYHRS